MNQKWIQGESLFKSELFVDRALLLPSSERFLTQPGKNECPTYLKKWFAGLERTDWWSKLPAYRYNLATIFDLNARKEID